MPEQYRPRQGDSVWIEGHNPPEYKAMKFWDPVNWGEEHSQPNAIITSTDREGAWIEHYDGYGLDFYPKDCFELKHYNPGSAFGHWIIRF